VDTTLTYKNARLQGYQWVMDVLRDDQGNIEELGAIERFVKEEGYRLGQPWANNEQIVPYGLYRPIHKRDELKKVTEKEEAEPGG
jgi:hypothetical protein